MIPLISSLCQGTLGVCQLPRFWWKRTTRSVGLLDPDYPDCSDGLDASVLEVLGLNRERTLGYLRDELPNYLAFELWVGQQSDKLNRSAIRRWNDAVHKRVHSQPKKLVETYCDIGWTNDKLETGAVLLNSLQDWQLFHRRDLVSTHSTLQFPVVPLVSSIDVGPLGVCQLPRTWLKIVLQSKELLHEEYPACGNGLDKKVLEVLQLDREEVVGFVSEGLPSYLEFEAWIVERSFVDNGVIADWNTSIRERIHGQEKRAEIHATLKRSDDGTLKSAVTLNHLEDWHLAHLSILPTA